VPQPQPRAGYLRDTRSAVISTRPAYLRDSRDEIRLAWTRAAGIALDLIQNSGRLRGAADQVIADTVGTELILNPQPDAEALGWSPEFTRDWVRRLKKRWKIWSWNPRECDMRGKHTIPQSIDIVLRWDMAFGEATGLIQYFGEPLRRRYGIRSGTKLCLVTPTKLVQDTNTFENIHQGVIHDENGRPVAYRFEEDADGYKTKRDHAAYDAGGRQQVIHVYDPMDVGDSRGISRMAAGFRKHIQHEILVDATIQTSILQTIFGIALTSALPSHDAFEAIMALGDGKDEEGLDSDYRDYFQATLERAAEGKISISGDPTVSHLAPGEDLKFLTSGTPGPQFLPVSAELSRDMARAIGITYGGLTMDHSSATYSSVRMDNSSVWPVVLRRRERIAAPVAQAIYEAWLDEEIGTGRLDFPGGHAAFLANRDLACWALWQGPAKPSADDGKSAKAATERITNGTSTLAAECAEIGADPDEVFEQRVAEHKRYLAEGMPSPFVPKNSAPQATTDDENDRQRRREDA
jgi:lambda family phage portal protein